MDRIRKAPNTNSNMHEISPTLSLLNVEVEYDLLVLCVALNSACDDIFLLKRFQSVNAVDDMDCCLDDFFNMDLTC